MTAIGTYGFRGEALASISHIAQLSVTTKTQDSSCAWKAQYSAGKLVSPKPGQSADPKATAGKQGTQIAVEDLFYNVPTRRRAFRSPSEEYAKILDLVGRYAVHCTNVAFTCKKHAENTMGISIPANAKIIDRIRQIHNSSVANELIEVTAASDMLGFTAHGWVSNANYSVKRTSLLLFINHRSVESSPIKKAVEQAYATFLPKGGHPFVYLSIEIEPHRVDVNVHPTKREVRFLHEDEIIEIICEEITNGLSKVDKSRTFMTQSILPGGTMSMAKFGTAPGSISSAAPPQTPEATNAFKTPARKSASQKPNENSLVRTDARERKITSMIPSLAQQASSDGQAADDRTGEPEYEVTSKEPVVCQLTSIKELRDEVREDMHNDLFNIFAGHTYVGIVDYQRRMVAIQGGVKLYLIDYAMICNEYFYQVGLTDFGNFGAIRFAQPLALSELLEIGTISVEESEGHPDEGWEPIVKSVEKMLVQKRAMLSEYFNITISEDGMVHSIPLLMKGYMPCMAKLPLFLLRLGFYVDWTQEKSCFRNVLQELASFYVPEPLPPPTTASGRGGTTEDDEEIEARRKHLARAIESVLFPAFRVRLVPTKALMRGVLEVANLKGLYRVFERC